MKKLFAFILAFCLFVCLSACQHSPAPADPVTEPLPSTTEPVPFDTTPVLPAPTPAQAPMFSISLPIVREETRSADDNVLFTFTYQEIALILPEPDVAEKIIVHYLNALDDLHQEAQTVLSAAESAYQGQAQWRPYSCTSLYDVTRIDNNVVSLHGSYSAYTAAAHPTHITQCANYDLITGDYLTLDEILQENAQIQQIYPLLIAQLNTIAQNTSLYPDYADIVSDILGYDDFDNWYFTADGLCFCFSPYEIAPYASGIVEAIIPYGQLQGILLDSYFPMEWAYEGTVVAEPFENVDMKQFTQSSELILHDDATQVLLHSANTAVCNISIEYGTISSEDSTQFLPQATVFACASLTPGDAIILQAQLSDLSPTLRIRYQSGNETFVKYLMHNRNDHTFTLSDM